VPLRETFDTPSSLWFTLVIPVQLTIPDSDKSKYAEKLRNPSLQLKLIENRSKSHRIDPTRRLVNHRASRISRPLTKSLIVITILAVLATLPTLPYAAHGVTQSPTQPTFNFKMSNSNNIAVVQGGEGSNNITVTLERGTPGFVLLSCNNLPMGATCSFNPQTAVPTFTSTLTIATSFSTPVGAVTVSAVGTGGGMTNSTQFTLNVKPAGSVGGVSLPTGGNQLVPFAGVGIALLAIIGAAIYGLRSRARAGGSSTNLNKL